MQMPAITREALGELNKLNDLKDSWKASHESLQMELDRSREQKVSCWRQIEELRQREVKLTRRLEEWEAWHHRRSGWQ